MDAKLALLHEQKPRQREIPDLKQCVKILLILHKQLL
jgi:hypothetical protein